MLKKVTAIASALMLSLAVVPAGAFAQELHNDLQETVRAHVDRVLVDEDREVPGTTVEVHYQKLLVTLLEGTGEGKQVEVENDYVRVDEGDKIYVNRLVLISGQELYTFGEPDRTVPLLTFLFLFIITVVAFGGKQGARGLISLAGSIFVIIYALLPTMLSGVPPIAASIVVASVIILFGSYVTHGVNRATTSAVLGMIVTVIFTGFLAYLSVHWGQLTGLADENAIYLNFNSEQNLDLAGLLLGGMMIGLLGVLYDSAIGQSVAVDELWKTGPHLTRREIFKRATRIGREHVGALVTALAIAYVGAALPLLLLFYQGGSDFSLVVNREVVATEVMRTLVGSIGLVLAVPITTLISVFLIVRKGVVPEKTGDSGHHGHSHTHHGHRH